MNLLLDNNLQVKHRCGLERVSFCLLLSFLQTVTLSMVGSCPFNADFSAYVLQGVFCNMTLPCSEAAKVFIPSGLDDRCTIICVSTTAIRH